MHYLIIAIHFCILLVVPAAIVAEFASIQVSHLSDTQAISAISPENCTLTNLQTLKTCMLEYTNTYWMDKPNTEVPDYHSFHQRRMEYLMKCVVSNQSVVDAQCIVSVQKDICRWVNTMNNCTSAIASQCMTVESLKQLGLQSEDSNNYIIDYAISVYECGVAYDSLIANIDCYMSTGLSAEGGPHLQTCKDQMNQSIANGADMCSAENVYINCTEKVFRDACGQSCGDLACNIRVVAMNAEDDTCANKRVKCNSLSQTGSTSIPSSSGHFLPTLTLIAFFSALMMILLN